MGQKNQLWWIWLTEFPVTKPFEIPDDLKKSGLSDTHQDILNVQVLWTA
jgi:hypothetical protein